MNNISHDEQLCFSLGQMTNVLKLPLTDAIFSEVRHKVNLFSTEIITGLSTLLLLDREENLKALGISGA